MECRANDKNKNSEKISNKQNNAGDDTTMQLNIEINHFEMTI